MWKMVPRAGERLRGRGFHQARICFRICAQGGAPSGEASALRQRHNSASAWSNEVQGSALRWQGMGVDAMRHRERSSMLWQSAIIVQNVFNKSKEKQKDTERRRDAW